VFSLGQQGRTGRQPDEARLFDRDRLGQSVGLGRDPAEVAFRRRQPRRRLLDVDAGLVERGLSLVALGLLATGENAARGSCLPDQFFLGGDHGSCSVLGLKVVRPSGACSVLNPPSSGEVRTETLHSVMDGDALLGVPQGCAELYERLVEVGAQPGADPFGVDLVAVPVPQRGAGDGPGALYEPAVEPVLVREQLTDAFQGLVHGDVGGSQKEHRVPLAVAPFDDVADHIGLARPGRAPQEQHVTVEGLCHRLALTRVELE
jgi:hypothetical protein